MSLLDDFRNLLARHVAHVGTQTQQGTVALIEDHLNRLDAVVSNDFAAGEAEVHKILGELYAATNAPAPSAAPVPDAPSEPVAVTESGPEAPAPTAANPTSMAPAALPTPDRAPAVEEAPAPAETAETNPAA